MTHSEQIDEILLRWDELREQGTAPPAEELCRDYPELAGEVRRRIRALQAVYGVPNGGGTTAALGEPTSSPVAPGTDAPGLNDYEILELLGAGGMGKVFKARHKTLKRLVALKMILAGARATPQEIERFRIEAEAVARLQHPNIVQIYEVGTVDSCPFLALEYLEGGNLESRLQGRPLPPRQAAELLRAVAAAMHYAHQHNIVHRDLKPANILLTADGVPKVADFGLAKQLDEALGQTRTGSVLGTPSYMAPEQADGRLGQIGPATDVYALGAVLYQLLTGQPPFQAPTLLATLEKLRTEEPAPPRRAHPEVPTDLETICLKCLQKEPAGRYPSAGELADDLQRFLDDEPIRGRTPGLVDRLKSTLNRTRGIPDMTRSLRLLRLLGLSLILIQVIVFLVASGGPAYPLAAFLALLVSVPLMMTAYLLYTGEGLRAPLTAATRHFWSVRVGLVLGLFTMPLVSWLMHPPGVSWNPLTVFPLWGVLAGVTWFGLGVYWGRLYLFGLAYFCVSILMVLKLDLAPLALVGMLSLVFWSVRRHIERLVREQDEAEKGLPSSHIKRN